MRISVNVIRWFANSRMGGSLFIASIQIPDAVQRRIFFQSKCVMASHDRHSMMIMFELQKGPFVTIIF